MIFNGDYVPPSAPGDRRRLLSSVWTPFITEASSSLSDSEIDDLTTWDGEEPAGNFWSNPIREVLRYAIRLIDTYRTLIPNDLRCPGMQEQAGARLDALTFYVQVDDGDGFSYTVRYSTDTEPESCACGCDTCLPVPTFSDSDGWKAVFTSDAPEVVVISYAHLAEHAFVADQFLYLAHVAWYYAARYLDSDSATAEEYRSQAIAMGRLALGAVAVIARTLLHEQVHRARNESGFDYSHCINGCCMQTIALRFQCSVHAYLGLYAVNTGAGGIDIDLNGDSVVYSSVCSSDGAFIGHCTMAEPGEQGNSSAWARTYWSVPESCDGRFASLETLADAPGPPGWW